jgi:hypothetical protein
MSDNPARLYNSCFRKEPAMVKAVQSDRSAAEDDFIETMTREEGKRLFDRQARKFLGMSGEEFYRRYRAGEIEDPYRLEVARVAMLLPLAEL